MQDAQHVAAEVKQKAIAVLRQGYDHVVAALSFLTEPEVWRDFNPHLVSVGNLILHLIGNLSSWRGLTAEPLHGSGHASSATSRVFRSGSYWGGLPRSSPRHRRSSSDLNPTI